jgi:NADH-quinone oxidoreductase subunit N
MAARLAQAMQTTGGLGADQLMVLALGALMLMVGLAFKLSAVPFHFWCPDVFEGASAEVNAFLSVASKAAALALLVRVAIGFSYVGPSETTPRQVAAFSVADEAAQLANQDENDFDQRLQPHTGPLQFDTTLLASPKPDTAMSPGEQLQSLSRARTFVVLLLSLLSVITCTFGNLAAYGQNNIKRLLAYSTIAHAGYMIMPVAAAVALAGSDPDKAAVAIGSLTFYVGVYLFMNLGAFAVVAFLRNLLGSEDVRAYAGLVRRSPVVVVCFVTILISLVGLPPLAGFIGKFAIFSALVEAKLWALLVIAGLNTAISLYYYLRVAKIMTIDPEPDDRVPVTFSFVPATFIVAITLPVLLLGIWPNGLNQWALAAARHLFS